MRPSTRSGRAPIAGGPATEDEDGQGVLERR
jgi:hypothetical protein